MFNNLVISIPIVFYFNEYNTSPTNVFAELGTEIFHSDSGRRHQSVTESLAQRRDNDGDVRTWRAVSLPVEPRDVPGGARGRATRDPTSDGLTIGQFAPPPDICSPEITIGNESVPKIIITDTVNLFFKLRSAFCYFQTITVSECCLIKSLPYILFMKNIFIF